MIPKCHYKPKKIKYDQHPGTYQCSNIPILKVHKDTRIEYRKEPDGHTGHEDIISVCYEHSWEDLCSYHEASKVGKET